MLVNGILLRVKFVFVVRFDQLGRVKIGGRKALTDGNGGQRHPHSTTSGVEPETVTKITKKTSELPTAAALSGEFQVCVLSKSLPEE
jgi:hypothetical protein